MAMSPANAAYEPCNNDDHCLTVHISHYNATSTDDLFRRGLGISAVYISEKSPTDQYATEQWLPTGNEPTTMWVNAADPDIDVDKGVRLISGIGPDAPTIGTCPSDQLKTLQSNGRLNVIIDKSADFRPTAAHCEVRG